MPEQRTLPALQTARMRSSGVIKQLLGELPLTAEVYWQIRQRGKAPAGNFSFHRLENRLPALAAQAAAARNLNQRRSVGNKSRNILIFVTLRYWIEHGSLLALALAASGHTITLMFLPYSRWDRTPDRFDARRLNAYAHRVLSLVSPVIQPVSLLDIRNSSSSEEIQSSLPKELTEALVQVSLRDTQYTLQIEEVDVASDSTPSGTLYQLRQYRNLQAASSLMSWIKSKTSSNSPDLVLTPNGSILEMGAVYQVARFLGIPTVTYEFGEQRGRIWLAQDAEVMRQETDALWHELEPVNLSEPQFERVQALYSSRQNASLWENFGRLWQGQPLQGGGETRQTLNLDDRPVVLLAANVIGDSLTLGRQVFSRDMTEWLQFTVRHFSSLPDAQLVVRIHPGEKYTRGPSVADVVRQALPELPENIHLVQASDPINTYDLIEICDLSLVYTTTVGMEVAMAGVPAIVSGVTHYRGKGFTLDPASWQDYTSMIQEVLNNTSKYRLDAGQVQHAWQYAYHFYFNFPCPFPWHLLDYGESIATWSIERVFSEEGLLEFGKTFRYLAGEPRDWSLAGT